MRPGVLSVAGVLVLTASLAHAQTSTADGIEAFVRGDYQRAAEILKPIAESWPPRDRVAAFFMAMLYENGHGIQADPLRACALYVHASTHDPVSMFGRQAEALLRALQQSLGADAFLDCMLLVNVGFDHGFQPVTFTLEHGHWITINLGGARITYDGQEKRLEHGLATMGARFLPVEHTELTVGRGQSARRHFIEFFTWIPKQQWTLLWRVFEVVRLELVEVTVAELMTVSAERPPADPSLDVRSLARLSVNDEGNAEWAVLSGPEQGSGVIEPDSDRRERAEQKRTRAAADARVDWNRTRDVQRPPALEYSDGDGCGDVFLYRWSGDRTEAITIRADKELLGLSTAPLTFDLASQREGLELVVHVNERPVRQWPFCTDAPVQEGPTETWRATRGTVTIELSQNPYRATIRIVGAEFVSGAGVRVKQVQPITLTALVGRVFG